MEIRCLVIKFLIQIASTYSTIVSFILNNITLITTVILVFFLSKHEQESPAIADKPARRESLPKTAPIRRAYNVVADDTGLSSFSCCCIRNVRNHAKFTKNSNLWSSRSSILVSMESPYQSLIVTVAVSATFFEIFTVKDRKLLILHTPVLFDALQRWNAIRYRHNLYTADKCI